MLKMHKEEIMFHQNTWSDEEIETLKVGFLQGKRLKEIARELDRTPTALNKALTRFGIRPKGIRKQPLNWEHVSRRLLEESSLVSKKTTQQKRIVEASKWVPLKTVMSFLTKSGDVIKTIHHKGDDACDVRYLISGRIYSPLQLVLKANRLRSEQSKPIFLVEDITW